MNILVTGATGYIGGLLIPWLGTAGHTIVGLARDPNRLAGHKWKSITIRQGDVYWYGLFLIHQLIFSGMAREIAQRAESQD
jgi:uncharacterized protein YbjT (DUF2867 family)